MACKKLFVDYSEIQGAGLYAGEDINAGDIVMLWMDNAHIITEKEYNIRQDENDKTIKVSGVRYVGDYFLYTDGKGRYENSINHSFTPNLLYHCGVCFALTDIKNGDELTIDYTYLLSENDIMGFVDKTTGKQVKGLPALEGLQYSCDKLATLLKHKKENKKNEYLRSLEFGTYPKYLMP